MSNRALTWAFGQPGISPGEKLVLLALADYADDDNHAWPRQATLVEKTNFSETSVRKHLASLTARGLIARRHRNGGHMRRRSDLYTLAVDITVGAATHPPSEAEGVKSAPAESAVGLPRNTPEHSLGMQRMEPSVEPTSEPSVTSPRSTAVDLESSVGGEFEEFWDFCRAKVDKKKCERRFAAAVKRGVDPRMIIRRWGDYLDATRTRDIRHVKRPLTWLIGENWNDDLEAERPVGAASHGAVGAADIRLEDKPWFELMDF